MIPIDGYSFELCLKPLPEHLRERLRREAVMLSRLCSLLGGRLDAIHETSDPCGQYTFPLLIPRMRRAGRPYHDRYRSSEVSLGGT